MRSTRPRLTARSAYRLPMRSAVSARLCRVLIGGAVCGWCIAAAPLARAADLPDVLPYGVDNLPATPIVRVNATPPRTVDLLGERLKSAYVAYRVQSLTELGQCELPAGAKFIRHGLGDPEPLVRAAAVAAAGRVGDATLAADLKNLSHDADPRVRRETVLTGRLLGDESLVDAGLADSDASVVLAAVTVSAAAQGDRVAAALAGYPPGTQIAAMQSLGRIANAKYADAAAGYLGAAVPQRIAAITAIGQMKSTAHAAAIEQRLADEHPSVRRVALQALPALVSVNELQAKCIAALRDADNSVREAAARILQQSPTPDALVPLVAALPSESSRLHDAARDALVAVGAPSIPAAAKMLTDSNPRRREDGSYLLGHLKSDASLDAHIALVKDADWAVVRQAVVSLGLIRKKEALPAVTALAERGFGEADDLPAPDAVAASAAIEQAIVSAAELGGTGILPQCRAVLPKAKTVPALYRAAAAYAIGRLGDPADKSLAMALERPIADSEEALPVQLECLKAIGQLKLPIALKIVGTDRTTSKVAGDAHTDWLCYWVRSRVSGKAEPLTPMESPWNLSLSVSPMPAQ